MKNFRIKKRAGVLLAAIALIIGVAVGGTIAYLIDQTEDVVNTFTPTEVDIDIYEEWDGKVKKFANIENKSDIPVYVRAKIIVEWKDDAGNIYGVLPIKETDYTMQMGEYSWQYNSDDGFYYHNSPVNVGAHTSDLFSNCKCVSQNIPEGYDLHVEVIAQAVQAVPTNVVASVWPVSVDGSIITPTSK